MPDGQDGSILVLSVIALGGSWLILTVLLPIAAKHRLRLRLSLMAEQCESIAGVERVPVGEMLRHASVRAGQVGVIRLLLGLLFRGSGGSATTGASLRHPLLVELRQVLAEHIMTSSPAGWALLPFPAFAWLMHGGKEPFWAVAEKMLPGSPDPAALIWPEGRPRD